MYAFKLIVKQTFRDVEDHKTLHNPGSFLETEKVGRVNSLVSRGLAELVSVEAAKGGIDAGSETIKGKEKKQTANPDKVAFNGSEYDPQVIKEALISIGVNCAPNAGVKGLTSKVGDLTEDQKTALNDVLD